MRRYIPVLITLLASPVMLMAQEAAAAEGPSFFENYAQELTMGLIIIGAIVLVFGFFMVWQQIVGIHRELSKNDHYKKSLKQDRFPRWFYFDFKKINEALTDAVPVEEEEDIMLDHDYDGIKELNNHLPPWWTMLFYGTIIYGVVYFVHFEWLGTGMDQYEEYQAEVEQAEKELAARMELVANSVNETNVVALEDEASIAAGQQLFSVNCVACHGEAAQGTNVGPNLTDQYWIHGGDVKDVFRAIKYGFEGKMVPWGEQLKPQEMQQIASYVMNLQGSNPPNAKEPEGDFYAPSENSEEEPTEVNTPAGDTTPVEADALPVEEENALAANE